MQGGLLPNSSAVASRPPMARPPTPATVNFSFTGSAGVQHRAPSPTLAGSAPLPAAGQPQAGAGYGQPGAGFQGHGYLQPGAGYQAQAAQLHQATYKAPPPTFDLTGGPSVAARPFAQVRSMAAACT